MKVLFDTNVVVDLLLERQPHARDAAYLLSKAETGTLQGYVCATSLTTVHYLVARALGAGAARRAIAALVSFLEVAPVNRAVIEAALTSSMNDLEDAVECEAARTVGAGAVVTRNAKDFRRSRLPTHTPAELAAMLR
jgi:predicted nucleic acid-binding protein